MCACHQYRNRGKKTAQAEVDIALTYISIGSLSGTINNNNRYAITNMCFPTKYLVCIPIPKKESLTIAKYILQHFILILGPMPKMCTTDMSTEYRNKTLSQILDMLHIKHNTSTLHHQETVERNYRTLNECLRSYICETKNDVGRIPFLFQILL